MIRPCSRQGSLAALCLLLHGCGTASPSPGLAAHDAGVEETAVDAGPPEAADGTNLQESAPADAALHDSSQDASHDPIADTAPDNAPPAKGDCSSSHLQGCYRGMYVSLHTDHIGQVLFEGETEPYRFILGNPSRELKLLEFIAHNRIESLALYDLGDILSDSSLRTSLAAFMLQARGAGVLRIEAIAGTSAASWDNIAAFHEQVLPFDGMVTEIEFWNGQATLQQLLDILGQLDARNLIAASGGPATVSVYVGWVDQAEVDAMLPLIDRLYLHVYVDDPAQAFGYGKSRLQMVAEANQAQGRAVEVWPIFSAEDHAWSAGPEFFMGEWLAAHSLAQAELQFLPAYEADPLATRVSVTGFQYYDYFFLDRYLAQ